MRWNPPPPLAVILGGAKVSDKLKLIDNLVRRADLILIGGGMAATFLKAQGKPVGISIVEDHLLDYALELIRSGAAPIHLPTDVVAASEISGNPSKVGVHSTDDVPQDSYILDVGPRTVQEFCRLLSPCQTIIWNGPLGVFEYKPFAAGTTALANHLASLHGTTIIGGGSTASAVETLCLGHRMDHVSSGGGAMIEFLEGKELPGISALPSKSALQGDAPVTRHSGESRNPEPSPNIAAMNINKPCDNPVGAGFKPALSPNATPFSSPYASFPMLQLND